MLLVRQWVWGRREGHHAGGQTCTLPGLPWEVSHTPRPCAVRQTRIVLSGTRYGRVGECPTRSSSAGGTAGCDGMERVAASAGRAGDRWRAELCRADSGGSDHWPRSGGPGQRRSSRRTGDERPAGCGRAGAPALGAVAGVAAAFPRALGRTHQTAPLGDGLEGASAGAPCMPLLAQLA